MLDVKLHSSINEIDAQQWNSLCGIDYPFLRHEFLSALEESGSVSARNGWQPLHLSLEDNGAIVGLMPLYLKNHSYGEYVFDWSWADAWQQHGLAYYPKLVTAIPFTPAYGPRLGLAVTEQDAIPLLSDALRQICGRFGASGWHGLFLEQGLLDRFRTTGMQARLGTQYHWFNRGYQSFEHYLSHFNSRKRKAVRKERQKVSAQQVELSVIEGPDISAADLQAFYRFYQLTYLKRGRQGYLNQHFFELLVERMPEQLMLVLAWHQGERVAGALSLKSSNCLYGRYWGCLDEFDSLHFETCYYQGIAYCIEQGLARFDPGAQGEHKIQRGFEPIETWSAHWIEEPGFRPAIADFLLREQEAVQQQMEALSNQLPFRLAES